jgi:cyclin B
MQARHSYIESWESIGAASRPLARARGVDGNGALRSARSVTCENATANKARRSPRLGACSGIENHLGVHNCPNESGGALADITNVAAGWGPQTDEAKHKQSSLPQQQEAQSLCISSSLQDAVQLLQERAQQFTARELVDALPAQVAEVEDSVERANVQSVQEYAPAILNRLFIDEGLYLPQPDYIGLQTDVNGKMRMILIDWLLEVHMKYKLGTETLHLTVNLIDRYLSKVPVNRKRLQLVGVVAMFIASKYEEVRPPEINDWVYITDNAYTKKDVLIMECSMLTTLSFHIMVPTAAHFFEPLQKANGCSDVHREVAQYLLELGLFDLSLLQHTPSQMVAAALLLSNELLKRSPVWPDKMAQLARTTAPALRGCADALRQLHEAVSIGAVEQLQAVRKKFSKDEYHAVAKMTF